MKSSSTIGVWVCIIMILLSSGGVSNVLVPPYMLSQAGNDAWISVFVALPFVLAWCIAVWYVLRKLNGAPLGEWLSTQFSPTLSWMIRIPVIIMLYIQAASASWETGHIAVRSYMSSTPVWVIIYATTLLCVWTAYSGVRSIAFTSVTLYPVAAVLDALLLGVNYPHQDFRLLFPVMENGFMPVVRGAFLAAAGMIEIWLLLMVQQEVRGKFKWWQPVILVLYLAGLELIPLILSITILGPEQAIKLRGPILEIWRIASLGSTIEHIDLFAIVQRTSGTFARLSLQLFVISSLAGFKKPLHKAFFLGAVSLSICVISSLPISDATLIDYLYYVQYPAFLILVPLITVVLAVMVKRKPPAPRLKEAANS